MTIRGGSGSDPRPGGPVVAGGVTGEPSIDLTDPDTTLVDPELQSEIELMTELVLAAAQSTGPLTASQIDEILGLV